MCDNFKFRLRNQIISDETDNPHLKFGQYLISQRLDKNGKILKRFGVAETKYKWLFYQKSLITSELEYNMATKQ